MKDPGYCGRQEQTGYTGGCNCPACVADAIGHQCQPERQAGAVIEGTEALITARCACGAHKLYRVPLDVGTESPWCPPLPRIEF